MKRGMKKMGRCEMKILHTQKGTTGKSQLSDRP